MQRKPLEARRWLALCVASLLLGCPASDTSGDPETATDASGSSGDGPQTSGATGDSTSSSDGSMNTEATASSDGTTVTGPSASSDSGETGVCPADAECSGPDDTSCEFGGTCLACGCIGGEPPPKATYGDCSACLPNEWPLEGALGCVCMPQCGEGRVCPAVPGRQPGVPEPQCFVGGFEGCLIPCSPSGGSPCPTGMSCEALGKVDGYCTFGLD